MGQLIRLDGEARKPSLRSAPPGGAKVVLFTGIRYERGAPVLPGKPPQSTKPKRKRG